MRAKDTHGSDDPQPAGGFCRGTNCRGAGNPATEPAHLAVALLDDTEGLTRPLLATLGVDPLSVRAAASQLVDRLPSASGASVGAPQPSRAFLTVLSAAETGGP